MEVVDPRTRVADRVGPGTVRSLVGGYETRGCLCSLRELGVPVRREDLRAQSSALHGRVQHELAITGKVAPAEAAVGECRPLQIAEHELAGARAGGESGFDPRETVRLEQGV